MSMAAGRAASLRGGHSGGLVLQLQPHGPAKPRIGPRPGQHFARCRQGQQCSRAVADDLRDQQPPQEKFSTATGLVEEVDEEEAEVDFLGESTEGNLHLVSRATSRGIFDVLGLGTPDDVLSVPHEQLVASQQRLLQSIEIPVSYPSGQAHRAVFCNRTLNLRSIQAIGYDLDYTLVHYSVLQWEGAAYAHALRHLRAAGCPVDGLAFDPDLIIRGLIIDKQRGNLLKVDRFGHVKRAMHGTRMLSWQELRQAYGRELVSLHNPRFEFLNTFFSVSEANLYAQMVDRLDQGSIPPDVCGASYEALHGLVSQALFHTHVEGKLKAEIIREPEKYVELDPDMARTLIDMQQAGKVQILITNSDFHYTDKMMSFAYDRFLPEGRTWRSLFDMVIVQARKPDFFSNNMSLYEIVTEDGLMRPAQTARKGGLYAGGSARMVERALGVEGDDILYVGDHIYTDAALAKMHFRWRTALIVRELEQEVLALAAGRQQRLRLKELMHKKELVGDVFNQLRLARQRYLSGSKAGNGSKRSASDPALQSISDTLAQLLLVMEKLDTVIGPLLARDGEHFNQLWGNLSRAGLNDKSQITRQIEKYADLYTSRVSNFLRYTPYMYFRSPSQSLIHSPKGGGEEVQRLQ